MERSPWSAAVTASQSSQVARETASEDLSIQETVRSNSLDGQWLRTAREDLPGFAGVYVDLEGRFVLNLKEGADLLAAEAHARSMPDAAGRPVLVRSVKYDFEELHEWREVAQRLRSDAAAFFDNDEVHNAVLIGVNSIEAVQPEAERLIAAGVPEDALRFRVIGPAPHDRATLNDVHGQGGTAVRTGFAGGYQPFCSVGVTGYFDGEEALVTASHCTTTKFGFDGDTIYQTISGLGLTFAVAEEVFDPTMSQVGQLCWWGGVWVSCRYSDTAVFEWISQHAMSPYEIARPTHSVFDTIGPRTISTTDPTFVVTDAELGWSVRPPNVVEKIGDRSGWTTGSVVTCFDHVDPNGDVIDCNPVAGPLGATCFNYFADPAPLSYNLYCQFEARLYSDVGDSGAPVFVEDSRYPIPDQLSVKLLGLIWGGPTLPGVEPDQGYYNTANDNTPVNEDKRYTWFSTWGGIRNDLTSTGSTIDICHPMGNPAC